MGRDPVRGRRLPGTKRRTRTDDATPTVSGLGTDSANTLDQVGGTGLLETSILEYR